MGELPATRTRFRQVTALGLWIGVAVLMAGAESPPVFSHLYHIEEEGAECDMCHIESDGSPDLVLNQESCSDCHDETPSWRLPVASRRLAARFLHRPHQKTLTCDDCHSAVQRDEVVAGKPYAAHTDCVACHRDRKVKVSEHQCQRCHHDSPKTVLPMNHQTKSWQRRHGNEARWQLFAAHGQACDSCHNGGQDCQACHREVRPRDHTALWANRLHGASAAWDRERCQTCHRPNVCHSCHRSATPQSHRGAWDLRHGLVAGGMNNNCQICHQRAWCNACHRQGR